MQPIERYGVIALLFLVIVVVVTVTWGDDAQPAAETGGFLAGGEVRAAGREARPDSTTRNKTTRPPLGRATASEAALATRLEQAPRSTSTQKPRDRGSLAETLRSVSEGALATERRSSRAPRTPDADPYSPMTRTQLAAQAAREISTQPRPVSKPAPTKTAVATQPKPRKIDATRDVYEVQPGDTLSVIAQKTLGTSTRWKEIAELNGNLDPRRMSVGMKLALPHGSKTSAPAEQKPTATPPATKAAGDYEIQNGDSLWKIAARQLGDGERWKEIAALNPKLDPNRLIVGRAIALPEGRTSSPSSMQVASADRPRGRVR